METLKTIGQITKSFWKAWRTYYLPSLRGDRVKRGVVLTTLRRGDKVLIDDRKGNVFQPIWTSGEVLEVFSGRDGRVRSALVDTRDGERYLGINRLVTQELDRKESCAASTVAVE